MRVLHRRYLHETSTRPIGRSQAGAPTLALNAKSAGCIGTTLRASADADPGGGIKRVIATLQTSRAYARSMCEGLAVRASELSLCVGRICVPSVGGAYAHALLAIGVLGKSVALPDKTTPGR